MTALSGAGSQARLLAGYRRFHASPTRCGSLQGNAPMAVIEHLQPPKISGPKISELQKNLASVWRTRPYLQPERLELWDPRPVPPGCFSAGRAPETFSACLCAIVPCVSGVRRRGDAGRAAQAARKATEAGVHPSGRRLRCCYAPEAGRPTRCASPSSRRRGVRDRGERRMEAVNRAGAGQPPPSGLLRLRGRKP